MKVRLLRDVELLTGRIRVASRSLQFRMRRKTMHLKPSGLATIVPLIHPNR